MPAKGVVRTRKDVDGIQSGGGPGELRSEDVDGASEVPLRRRLLLEGWEERFTASGSRLQEAVEYYGSLGYEVRVEPVGEAVAPGVCTSCFDQQGAEGPVGIVFTRGAGAADSDQGELFDE